MGGGYGSVLDVGYGDGKLFTLINDEILKTGVDLSQQATLFAKAFNPDAKILCKDIADVEGQYE